MRVHVDRDKCCGAGMCASAAPEVFDQSRIDGVVQIIVDTVTEAQLPRAQEAVRLCPVRAISLS